MRFSVALLVAGLVAAGYLSAQEVHPERRLISGIYPHLAMFNDENECGTGAVVPWAGRLWVITYAPHKPAGSSDKLYEVTEDLRQIVRSESIGGTPANRMIHRESRQLFIGPYVISEHGGVRVIPYSHMFGRPTANARHLVDPAHKIYCATMEEGVYEIDVETLEVTELWADEQKKQGLYAGLPGYHGKGMYSGQGRLVYANNGEHGDRAQRDPTVASGVLAEWDGEADGWTVVRRNQFTEVTGPGGIYGADDPLRDPIWSIGWDHRSLILQVLDTGQWHAFRLPKGSHSYDGAHGWNTEWPRIREIGEDHLLMTMHGLFWQFPRTFSATNRAGIAPRSAYLKVIGDFCRWQDRIVFGCDDTARSEFLNKRRAKGEIAAPQSQSNLWFVEPDQIAAFGPALGRGGVWVNEDVAASAVSDPFLVGGFDRGGLHLAHSGDAEATFVIEVDRLARGEWETFCEVVVPAHGHRWLEVDPETIWWRICAPQPIRSAVAFFHLSNLDDRTVERDPIFAGLARAGQPCTGGLIRARSGNKRTLAFAAMAPQQDQPRDIGCYELDHELQLRPSSEPKLHRHTKEHVAIPKAVLTVERHSVLYVDDRGKRWRLPRNGMGLGENLGPLGASRIAREVATERDLFHADFTFYELPANNAGGFAKVRPIATHDCVVHDFCSFRGMLVMTGVTSPADANDPHIVRTSDHQAALWVGAIDDLWGLGKPRGQGGPWLATPVVANEPSDPYLATGYDQKQLTMEHDAKVEVEMTVEADVCGDGRWIAVLRLMVPPGRTAVHEFLPGWSAYWLRFRASKPCKATAQLTYR